MKETEAAAHRHSDDVPPPSPSPYSTTTRSPLLLGWAGTFLVFALLGMGANWVLPTALFQEIPYLQGVLPEKLCLASQMNASVNAGVVMVIVYLYLLKRNNGMSENGLLSYGTLVPCILVVSCGASFLASVVYEKQVWGISLPLFFVCALGGAVGSTSSVVMNPFLMQFQSDFISATRAGGSGLILLTGVVAFAQQPGSAHQRFSPAAYFQIFASILILPVFALVFIQKFKPGLRDDSLSRQPPSNSDSMSVNSSSSHPLTSPSIEILVYNPAHARGDARGDEAGGSPSSSPSSPSQGTFNDYQEREGRTLLGLAEAEVGSWASWANGQALASGFVRVLSVGMPNYSLPRWLPRVLPYCFAVGFVNLNAWGLLSSVTPFAFALAVPPGSDGASSSSSSTRGSENLATAYEVGSLALVLGDLSTTQFRIPVQMALVAFVLLAVTIYAAALDSPTFHTASSGPILICVFGLSRFLEAHTVTTAYRTVAAGLSALEREDGARAIGIFDQASTTIGSIIATSLINTVAKC